MRKEYIARVNGRFPDGEIICSQPILQISPKLGLNRVRANGKEAKTFFKRLAYYEAADTAARPGHSIVRCLPITGRTHQIRVHLQFLGYPIQNDPIYANASVWGHTLGFDDADGAMTSDEDVITRLSRMGKDQVAQAVAYYDEMIEDYEKKKAERLSGDNCSLCEAPLYTDPSQQELSLWLHSVRYEDAAGSWSYASPLPTWALPPESSASLVQADKSVPAQDTAESTSDADGDLPGVSALIPPPAEEDKLLVAAAGLTPGENGAPLALNACGQLFKPV